MGEARRRKLAGNTEPDPNYHKNKRIPNYEIEHASRRLSDVMIRRDDFSKIAKIGVMPK